FSEKVNLEEIKLFEYSTKITEEDFKTDSSGSLKVGNYIEAKINFMNESSKYVTSNEMVINQIRLKSKGAFYLDIGFEKFKLSENASIYVFSKDRKAVLGAFTHLNNRDNLVFQTAAVKGEEIVLELNCPKSEREQNVIEISSITHYFKDWFGTADQLPCHNHVNCDESNDWCNQIRSVVLYTFPRKCDDKRGTWTCSGAMMNNYYTDFTPYFLTAEHCTTCDIDWDKTMFYFNVQSPNCRDEWQNNWYTVQGSRRLTACGSWAWNTTNTDVALLELQDKVPLQYNTYFAGYDTRPRGEWDGDDYVTAIHHPKGGVKRISHGIVDANFFSFTWVKTGYWHVCYYDGITQSGSSGSPVFLNKSKRVMGVTSHSTNSEDCEGELCDYVSKLRSCWHNGGTQKYLGKGIATEYLNGADPVRACLPNIELNGRFRDAREYRAEKHKILIQGSDNITLGNKSKTIFEDNANFEVKAENEINIIGEVELYDDIANRPSKNVELEIYTKPCTYVEDECGFNYFKMASDVKNSNLVEVENKSTEIKIYPNPTNQNSTLTLIGYQDKKVEILVLDQSGKTIYSKSISKIEAKEQTTEIESRN
nr:serine protease [Flavobacterium sp.]